MTMIGKYNKIYDYFNNMTLDQKTVCFIIIAYMLAGIAIFIAHYVLELF